MEVMSCEGGCVNGGGQPHVPANFRNFNDFRVLRAGALYEEDAILEVRKSHKNPEIKKLYADYLGAPNGHKAHDLLHTKYFAREKFPINK